MATPKKILQWKGRDRHRITQLKIAIKHIQDMDVRNQAAATKAGVTAKKFAVQGAANVTGALGQVLDRCVDALKAKVSRTQVEVPA